MTNNTTREAAAVTQITETRFRNLAESTKRIYLAKIEEYIAWCGEAYPNQDNKEQVTLAKAIRFLQEKVESRTYRTMRDGVPVTLTVGFQTANQYAVANLA